MKKFSLISLLLIALVIEWPAAYAQRKSATPASTHGNPEYITAAQMKDYLYFIAADEMEGRDTPSRGLDTVAKFIAFNFSRWGLKPAGDHGTYVHRISLQRLLLDPRATHIEHNVQALKYCASLLPRPG